MPIKPVQNSNNRRWSRLCVVCVQCAQYVNIFLAKEFFIAATAAEADVVVPVAAAALPVSPHHDEAGGPAIGVVVAVWSVLAEPRSPVISS